MSENGPPPYLPGTGRGTARRSRVVEGKTRAQPPALKAPRDTVERARRLRKQLSPAELRLWLALRARPGDLKFRKQHPAGFFALDFFCAAARLCIEVDGEAHDRGDQPAFDDRRDTLLRLHGIETLRVSAADVFGDLDAVLTHIVETARARLPFHHPAAPDGPPPRAGEEQESS